MNGDLDLSLDLVLAAYLSEACAAKRVLVVGATSPGTTERLGRVASELDVLDPRAIGTRARRGNVLVQRMSARNYAAPAPPYDVLIASDLVAIEAHEPTNLDALLANVREGGLAVLGVEAKGAVAYERFFELVRDRFPSVRLTAQAPFRGLVVADLGAEEASDIVVDGTLLDDETEEATRYVALCGNDASALPSYCVVQVPASTGDELVATSVAFRARPDVGERLRELEKMVDARTAALAELDGELEQMRLTLEATRAESETRHRALHEARTDVEKLREDLSRAEKEQAETETRLAGQAAELLALRAESTRRETLTRDLTEQLRDARERAWTDGDGPLRASETRIGELEAKIRHLEADRDDARRRLDGALTSAVAAEASTNEAQFTIDELRSKLAAVAADRDALAAEATRDIDPLEEESSKNLRQDLLETAAERDRARAEVVRLTTLASERLELKAALDGARLRIADLIAAEESRATGSVGAGLGSNGHNVSEAPTGVFVGHGFEGASSRPPTISIAPSHEELFKTGSIEALRAECSALLLRAEDAERRLEHERKPPAPRVAEQPEPRGRSKNADAERARAERITAALSDARQTLADLVNALGGKKS